MSDQKLAVFASGRGSHLTNLFRAISQGDIDAEISLVVSDVEGSGAAQFAEAKGIPLLLVSVDHASSAIARNQRILEALTFHAIDWVLCLGYLKKVGANVVEQYAGKMINIHPSLLPKFGGQGMYGMNVHQAVIDAGESVSGATVHYVNEAYDEGAIIAQAEVDVPSGATPEDLAALVLKAEHALLITTLKRLIDHHD